MIHSASFRATGSEIVPAALVASPALRLRTSSMTVSSVSLSACDVEEVAATAAGVTGLRGAACWRVAGARTGAATGLAGAGAVGLTMAVAAGAGAVFGTEPPAVGCDFGAAAVGFSLSFAGSLPAFLPASFAASLAGFFAASFAGLGGLPCSRPSQRLWCRRSLYPSSLADPLAGPFAVSLAAASRCPWRSPRLSHWIWPGGAADRQPCHQAHDQTGGSPCGARKRDHGVSSPRISQLAQDLAVQDLAVFD